MRHFTRLSNHGTLHHHRLLTHLFPSPHERSRAELEVIASHHRETNVTPMGRSPWARPEPGDAGPAINHRRIA
jgi:hypothetical protein